jgi:hypothetical protein
LQKLTKPILKKSLNYSAKINFENIWFRTSIITMMFIGLISSSYINPIQAYGVDSDPDQKSGGGDPIVFGKWGFIELGNGKKCGNSPNPFDYDNDSFKEQMCYWYHPLTKILFVDFNGNKKLDNGYELLNSAGYDNAFQILEQSPELCTVSDCYLWQDKNSNILIDYGELEPFQESFQLSGVMNYPSGKLITDNIYPRESREDNPRGFWIYGEAQEKNLVNMSATKPTYWMKGTK